MATISFFWLAFLALTSVFLSTLALNPYTRQLDRIAGGEVLRREIRDIKEHNMDSEFPRANEPTKTPNRYQSGSLDSIGGGNLLRQLAAEELLENSEYRERGLLALLDRLTGGEISRSLNNVDASDFLMAMEEVRKEDSYRHKRALDSIAGVTFGEMKRLIPFRKRNFDEIDNVGFNNWAKRSYDPSKDKKSKSRMLALARRDFGGPHRYHLSPLAKNNFDEIDRAGFRAFSKSEA